jgi:hypothetical protein
VILLGFCGVFLRHHRKEAAGETYEYWTLCDLVRTAAGPRQRIVATLGKLDEKERVRECGWEDIDQLLEGGEAARQMELRDKGQPAPAPPPRWELVDVGAVRVERARDFGESYLGLALWRRVGLHKLVGELIEAGKEEVPWEAIASVLTVPAFVRRLRSWGLPSAGISRARWRTCWE